MARGTPDYFEGFIPTSQGTSQVTNLRAAVETELQAYQSSATTAWETYDTINGTAGSLDRVYRSVGDRSLVAGAGDAQLFHRAAQTSTTAIRFDIYQDWATQSSTGSRLAGSTSTQWSGLNTRSAIRYWGAVNEYAFVFLAKQDGLWHYLHVETPIRTHVPANANGIAFTTAAAAAGSNVNVTLDRDITASIVDSTETGGPQNVWIYNITPAATALRSDTIEIAEVSAIAAGSITFTTLSNSFESGAIVGLDPCPFFVCEDELLTTGGSVDLTLYFTNGISGNYTSATSQTADYENYLTAVAPTAVPNVSGIWTGARTMINMDQASFLGYRGSSELVSWFDSGTLTDADLIQPDFSTAAQRKMFASLGLGSAGPSLTIGPGAT